MCCFAPYAQLRVMPLTPPSTGVLKKVLRAQLLDTYDIEGIKALLDHLLAERCKESADSPDTPSGPDAAGSSCTPAIGAHSTCEDSLDNGQCEAIKRLCELDTAAAFQTIRQYLTAATAKDLSIMITLRRTSGQTTPVQPDDSHIASLGWTEGRDLIAHILSDGSEDIIYKVALVDLDLKPLRKIYEHWRLDRDIMNCL